MKRIEKCKVRKNFRLLYDGMQPFLTRKLLKTKDYTRKRQGYSANDIFFSFKESLAEKPVVRFFQKFVGLLSFSMHLS